LPYETQTIGYCNVCGEIHVNDIGFSAHGELPRKRPKIKIGDTFNIQGKQFRVVRLLYAQKGTRLQPSGTPVLLHEFYVTLKNSRNRLVEITYSGLCKLVGRKA
jgi:hypothetical protein